jgi:signal transduction histidine kinase
LKAENDIGGIERRQIDNLCHSFLSGLAHIGIRLTLAQSNVSFPERISHDLERISAEVRLLHLKVTLADLLDCLQRGNITCRNETLTGHEIRRLVVEILTDYHITTGNSRGIGFEVHDCGPILAGFQCEVDKSLLIHLFAEVIGNAFKFSRAGTVVCARFFLEIPTHLSVSIENEGVVLRAAEVKHVTERGWRSHEAELCAVDGSGVGLWVASIVADSIGTQLIVRPTGPTGITSVEVSIPAKHN